MFSGIIIVCLLDFRKDGVVVVTRIIAEQDEGDDIVFDLPKAYQLYFEWLVLGYSLKPKTVFVAVFQVGLDVLAEEQGKQGRRRYVKRLFKL